MTRIRRTLGAPQSLSHAAGLIRDLRPLVSIVRAQDVKTPADARSVAAKLRSGFSDAHILRVVRARGTAAEQAASRPWLPLERLARRRGVIDARVRRRAPFDGVKLLDAWSRQAAALIKSVREEVAEGLRQDVVQALEAGTPPDALAAKWRAEGIPVKFGTLEGRAKVIARHQLSTLHAQVQSARARALGVSEFVWRSQGDSRVRDEHAALDGTKHSYADPPSEGLPGQPVGCRCWAESVVPDALAERLGVSFLPSGR